MARRRKTRMGGFADVRSCVAKELGSRPEATCEFLDALSDEVVEIAAHVESNWQDRAMGRKWRQLADRLYKESLRCKRSLPF